MHVVVWSRCGDKDCTHWKIIYIKNPFPLLNISHSSILLTGSSEGSGRNSASSPKIKSGGNSG